ncbi:hypothetical protein BT69DRAFT_1089948 [Atractiella rhizophila]|nr:hypothetical protein BT69DRAFT_1089948 [Atractiella rhizophila]
MSRPIPQTPSKKRSRRAEGEREEEIHITPQRPKKQRVGNFQLPSPAPSSRTPTSRPATAGVISSEGKEKSQKTRAFLFYFCFFTWWWWLSRYDC